MYTSKPICVERVGSASQKPQEAAAAARPPAATAGRAFAAPRSVTINMVVRMRRRPKSPFDVQPPASWWRATSAYPAPSAISSPAHPAGIWRFLRKPAEAIFQGDGTGKSSSRLSFKAF
ncbi:hypothetical protein EVAR_4462_1 [Eumeta japonica]|uniref:Uncharacterized protein n=1 Tax=Eumeta variegata TaxID=151549 RepID=A0A4C1SYN7_EUMVA|nr:hypothetical protein EVAR_4462_1 [Eumeta japonica]